MTDDEVVAMVAEARRSAAAEATRRERLRCSALCFEMEMGRVDLGMAEGDEMVLLARLRHRVNSGEEPLNHKVMRSGWIAQDAEIAERGGDHLDAARLYSEAADVAAEALAEAPENKPRTRDLLQRNIDVLRLKAACAKVTAGAVVVHRG